MVPERNHGLDHPENGAIVSEEVIAQRDELHGASPHQETLDVLVEPRLVPARDVVDLSLFLLVLDVGKVADHDHGIGLVENGRLHEIWGLQ